MATINVLNSKICGISEETRKRIVKFVVVYLG